MTTLRLRCNMGVSGQMGWFACAALYGVEGEMSAITAIGKLYPRAGKQGMCTAGMRKSRKMEAVVICD